MRHKKKKIAAAIAAALAVWAFWPHEEPVGAPAEPPYLTIFMVDGLNRRVFEEELAAGRMPNVKRLIDQGAYVRRGVVSFPSMTGYGFYPLLTGVDATKSGVLGLRWIDRKREQGIFRTYVGSTNGEMNTDLVPEPKSLFERFGDAHSLTINSYNNRGAVRSIKTGFKFTAAKYEGHWWVADLLDAIPVFESELSPDWAEVEAYAVDLALADLVHKPKVQWITFVSPDTYAHVNGLGPRYPELVRIIDDMVGRYVAGAEGNGERIYAFVSDHGAETVTKNVDLRTTLKSCFRGEATELFRSKMTETVDDFAAYDTILAINGNLLNYVYVKSASGWAHAPTPQELRPVVDRLLAAEGVEHVIARSDLGVEVFRAGGGQGVITTSSAGWSWRFDGEDPFGYGLDDRARSKDAWLAATKDSTYPYAIVRIAELMVQDGAGDLIVTSAPGYDLALDYELFVDNYQGGHGGMRADQLLVPFVLAGPGVLHTKVDAMTIEDFGKALVLLLDEEARRDEERRRHEAGSDVVEHDAGGVLHPLIEPADRPRLPDVEDAK